MFQDSYKLSCVVYTIEFPFPVITIAAIIDGIFLAVSMFNL